MPLPSPYSLKNFPIYCTPMLALVITLYIISLKLNYLITGSLHYLYLPSMPLSPVLTINNHKSDLLFHEFLTFSLYISEIIHFLVFLYLKVSNTQIDIVHILSMVSVSISIILTVVGKQRLLRLHGIARGGLMIRQCCFLSFLSWQKEVMWVIEC